MFESPITRNSGRSMLTTIGKNGSGAGGRVSV